MTRSRDVTITIKRKVGIHTYESSPSPSDWESEVISMGLHDIGMIHVSEGTFNPENIKTLNMVPFPTDYATE